MFARKTQHQVSASSKAHFPSRLGKPHRLVAQVCRSSQEGPHMWGSRSATELVADYIDSCPALKEMDSTLTPRDAKPQGISAWQQTGQERQSRPENEDQPSEAMLERWRRAYSVLATDAQGLGIPASAVPRLPDNANADDIRAARDHLVGMMESFCSACI
mmetsp:Transcript_17116/g.47470  ORF Transcript_17116/g.47470 Transcript_17116/m.47470 type:complete len:160 (-) Transcript_17116:248-727(-)